MPSIQSLGVGSGLLTTDLVEDLVASERASADLRLDLQQTEYEAEISAFGSVISAVEKLKTATDALKAPTSLQSVAATSSDITALTATASRPVEFTVATGRLLELHVKDFPEMVAPAASLALA